MPQKPHSTAASETSPLRLLFVERSADDTAAAVSALRRSGLVFEERTVTTPDELIQALNAGTWSAVIASAELSGFSSLEALRIVRERDEELPFIVLSAVDGERAIEILRAGASDHVAKATSCALRRPSLRAIADAESRRERKPHR